MKTNNDLWKMSHNELIIAEYEARAINNLPRADLAQKLRWTQAMGTIINSENCKRTNL